MGLIDPTMVSNKQYSNSEKITEPLVALILSESLKRCVERSEKVLLCGLPLSLSTRMDLLSTKAPIEMRFTSNMDGYRLTSPLNALVAKVLPLIMTFAAPKELFQPTGTMNSDSGT